MFLILPLYVYFKVSKDFLKFCLRNKHLNVKQKRTIKNRPKIRDKI